MSALHRERWFPVWLVVPGSISMMVLWLLPLAMLFCMVLGMSPESLQGVYQLIALLWQDEVVHRLLAQQGARLLLAVVLEMSLGLFLARLLPVRGFMASVWCLVLSIAVLTPLAVSSMSWSLLLHPQTGMLPVLSDWLGMPVLLEVASVLQARPQGGLCLYLLRDLWQWVPFFVLLCYARLRAIESVRYQALRFDGGGSWQAFRLLEWPLLGRMLLLGLLCRLLAGVLVDVELFNVLTALEDGVPARLAAEDAGRPLAAALVPGNVPFSWVLPSLLSSARQVGPAAVPVLSAYLALWQAVLVLPLMVALLALLYRTPRDGSLAWPAGVSGWHRIQAWGRPASGWLSWLGGRLVLVPVFLFVVLPLFWLLVQALSIGSPDGRPGLGVGNFVAVLDDPVWWGGLGRTAVRAMGTAVIAVVLALPIAYSWSRRMLAGDRLMAMLMLAGLAMPTVALALPMGLIHEILGWQGMPFAVGVAHLVYAVPLAAWVLVSSMARVPPALDEMAMGDGFSFMQFLLRVLLPAIRKGLYGALLVCFLMGWMEFLFARVLGSAVWPPVVVLLSESVAALSLDGPGSQLGALRVLAAASWLVLLPVVVVLLLLRRQLPSMLSMLRMPGARASGMAG